jgi:general secretion pathway protein N
MNRNIALLIIGLCCLQAWLTFVPAVQAQTITGSPLDNPVAMVSLDDLSATRARPLFSPSRRLPSPPSAAIQAPPPVQPPAPPPNLQLYGTILHAEDALAIVLSPVTNQTVRVRIGDDIGGWKVSEIDEKKIVLSLEDRTAVFTMFTEKPVEKTASDAEQDDQQEQADPPRRHK